MKTSINLDDDLLTKAKVYAATTGKTFTAVVEEALREMLARRVQADRPRVSLTTVKGKGVRPGIDLDDSASLLEKMEELDVSS